VSVQPVAAEDIPWLDMSEHGGIWVESSKKHGWWCVEFRPITKAAAERKTAKYYVFGYFPRQTDAEDFAREVQEAEGTYAKPLAVLTSFEFWGADVD